MNQTQQYVEQLTGSIDTVMEWRCISDTNKGAEPRILTGSVAAVWDQLQAYNQQQYGIFTCVNQLDGQGRELANVSHIRAHVADLDNTLTSEANYQRAVADGATFSVQSSPNKYHVYWKVEPYSGNDFYTMMQRKLIQYYDGDKSVIDATRVMRVPGFLHQKAEPFMVTGQNLSGATYTSDAMQTMLQAVNVIQSAGGMRSPLGEPSMQAPSLEWLRYALALTDPNSMSRDEWVSMSAAIKQAGWSHTDEETLYSIWSEWCARYGENDDGENRKLWNSFRDSQVGWTSIEHRSTVKAHMMIAASRPQTTAPTTLGGSVDTSGEMLSPEECAEWFKNCYFVEREGKIFSSSMQLMNATQFNGKYGGKQFIYSSAGKITIKPWEAALFSSCWTVPKVHHTRFLPDMPSFEIVHDALGRKGLNTYIPADIDAVEGDISLWFEHVEKMLPVESDRKLLFDYLAHNVKYPGFKIPWAPLLQSAEGIGKSVFIQLMQHALGNVYTYSPTAKQLVKSGSTFNAWTRGKLMIMVNEIRVGEKLDLIDTLKPMITEKEIEVQSKGVDQEMADNLSNWFFFSNFKDAIPINENGRRYAIFYSILQSALDIENAGMDDPYFDRLFAWLRDGGFSAITYWLLTYPIERGQIPMRSPKTSSHDEALKFGRSPIERIIDDCVQDGVCGFRGGYVSTLAVLKRCREDRLRGANARAIQVCLEGMGYIHLGRSTQAYIQEDITDRTELYGLRADMVIEGYAGTQGYT